MIIHFLINEKVLCLYQQLFVINVKQKHDGSDNKTVNKKKKSYMFV